MKIQARINTLDSDIMELYLNKEYLMGTIHTDLIEFRSVFDDDDFGWVELELKPFEGGMDEVDEKVTERAVAYTIDYLHKRFPKTEY